MGGQTNARRVTQWFFISIKATKKKHQMHIYVWQTWFLFRKRRKDQISNPFSFIQTHSWNKVWEKIKTDLRWTVYYKKKPISYKTLHFILIHYGFWIALTIKKKICDQLYHANQNAIPKTLRNVAIFEGSNFFHFHTKNYSPLLQYHYKYFLAVIFDNEYSNFLTQTCILRRQSNMEYACHFPTFRSF